MQPPPLFSNNQLKRSTFNGSCQRNGGALCATLCRSCWRFPLSSSPSPRPLVELPMVYIGAGPSRTTHTLSAHNGDSDGGPSAEANRAREGNDTSTASTANERTQANGAGTIRGSSGADEERRGAEAGAGSGPTAAKPTARGATTEAGGDGGEEGDPPLSPGVRAALSMLAFYRNVLSPLMPSTCRFLPTCSNYSIESYKKFGVTRGTVLTAWRLLRCNPWGGRGYDPPSWPPVGLGAVYQLPYTPELTVVLGAVLAYWLVASTVESLVR